MTNKVTEKITSAIGETIANSFATIMTEPKHRLGNVWNAEGKKLMHIELAGMVNNVYDLEESLMEMCLSYPVTVPAKIGRAFKNKSTKHRESIKRLGTSLRRVAERFSYMAYGKSLDEIN
jgi:hypothetical protein